ncbi:hypothetical protein [Blastococcus sp. TF02A-35]|uniref:hypothetical protein n=1 Tax=Blastococcus sp. TF02A-35 TaxID=2559612 RepID=UPI001073E77B|nr:hypothetical protein [Blastococcus sp. TF02A_35]TFV47505.1 hypothetical protein E4P43_14900 [Blastococcus sp. TF02A_35]
MKIRINRDLITDRMNMLALHERAIVQRTQIPQSQFRQARQSGELDGHTSLSQLHRLATELGVRLTDLLDPPEAAAPQQEVPGPANDRGGVETLIPILVSATNMVSLAHAARVLGWSRDHMDAVLAAVPAALHGTGLRLHHVNGRAKVMSTDSPGRAVAYAIGCLQTMAAGLNLAQARTLRRIVNGETVFHRNIGKEEKLTLGALKNMGCIELDDMAQYRPTSDLALALPDLT